MSVNQPSFFQYAVRKIREGISYLPSTLEELSAWIYLSFGIIPILFIGLMWMLIDGTSSSGGVMIGLVVICQGILQIWPLNNFIGRGFNTNRLVNEYINGPGKAPGYEIPVWIDWERLKNRIYTLKQHPDTVFPIGNPQWNMALTVARVFYGLEWCMLVCSLAGTILWALGPV